MDIRVRTLESLLVEKGYLDPAALDVIIETYEKKIGPRNGAMVVARAWSDPAYLERLRKDATAVWDSTAELRYLVVPMRPDGTDGWSEEQLANLVTRDSMIGTGLALRPEDLT